MRLRVSALGLSPSVTIHPHGRLRARLRKGLTMRCTPAVFLFSIAFFAACAPRPPELRIAAMPPAILLPTAKAGITDGRGRFREIYCAVRADHGAELPFDR